LVAFGGPSIAQHPRFPRRRQQYSEEMRKLANKTQERQKKDTVNHQRKGDKKTSPENRRREKRTNKVVVGRRQADARRATIREHHMTLRRSVLRGGLVLELGRVLHTADQSRFPRNLGYIIRHVVTTFTQNIK
jgi:hypothetical protein